MLYRAVAALVVLFWLTMTALLLRHEIRPGDSALREVPVGHVVKLIFHHQQESDLKISNDKLRLGQLRITPRIDKAAGRRTLAFLGSLHIPGLPGAKSRRIAWDGELEMDKQLVIQRLRLGVKVHDPTELRSEILILPAENLAQFELRSPTGILERQSYTLDEAGARTLLQQFGLDSAMIPAQIRRGTPPLIKAQQSSLHVHGESMDTYRITVEANGQTWLECHVDQLGHIVRATTLLGYTFAPDEVVP